MTKDFKYDDSVPPIWETLSKIGEDACPNIPALATPQEILLAQLMDSNVAKNEMEWAARREIERLRAEHNSLIALAIFGRKCFESHRDGLNDLDGDDLQEWALEFGLLKETKVFAPCNSDPDVGCWCWEYHGEFPCICIKPTSLAQLPEKPAPHGAGQTCVI